MVMSREDMIFSGRPVGGVWEVDMVGSGSVLRFWIGL